MGRHRQSRSEPSPNRRPAAPQHRPICQAITGSATDGTAAAVRAMAALGSLWRPVRALTAAQLAAHRDALIHTAMAGCAPIHTRPDTPHTPT